MTELSGDSSFLEEPLAGVDVAAGRVSGVSLDEEVIKALSK